MLGLDKLTYMSFFFRSILSMFSSFFLISFKLNGYISFLDNLFSAHGH